MVLPALAVVVAPVGAVVAVHEVVVARVEEEEELGETRVVELVVQGLLQWALRVGDTPPSSAWYSQVLRWVALRV